MGMALAKVGKAGEALACLGEAIAADPENPLAKFERAGVLLGLERFHDALAELEALRVCPGLGPGFSAGGRQKGLPCSKCNKMRCRSGRGWRRRGCRVLAAALGQVRDMRGWHVLTEACVMRMLLYG